MVKKSIGITLYHANWCGHCVTFIPEWKKFVKKVKDANNKYNKVEIKTQNYEEKEAEKAGGAKINGEDVSGYPTVKIALKRGKEYKEYDMSDYKIERNSIQMLTYIKNICELL